MREQVLIDDDFFKAVYKETLINGEVIKEWGLSVFKDHRAIITRLNELYETEKQYKALKESINSKS